MWASILLFGILLPILSFTAFAAFLSAAIIMLRRRDTGERIQFTGVVFGYAALMMVIGIFIAASGFGLEVKAALGEAVSQDFAYGPPGEFDRDFGSPDAIDDDVERDVIIGAVLVLVGALMFAPHALGMRALRQRGARGDGPVGRGYNLVGLATATIGFLASGGTALSSTLERFADGSGGWEDHHPGEPLAYAAILFCLSAWFGYQLWRDVTRDIDAPPAAPAPSPAAA